MRQDYLCVEELCIEEQAQKQFVADFGQLLSANFQQLSSQSLDAMYGSPMGQLGRQVRTARLHKKWTPNQVAEKLGKNEAYIYAIEHGMIPADAIDPHFIRELARILEENPAVWMEILRPIGTRPPHLWQRKIKDYWTGLHLNTMPSLTFGSFQGMVTSVAATAVVCLLLIVNVQVDQMTTHPIDAVPTATASYTPASDASTHVKFSSYSCNAIQPDPTYRSLACYQVFTLWPEPNTPTYRGGPIES